MCSANEASLSACVNTCKFTMFLLEQEADQFNAVLNPEDPYSSKKRAVSCLSSCLKVKASLMFLSRGVEMNIPYLRLLYTPPTILSESDITRNIVDYSYRLISPINGRMISDLSSVMKES